MSQTVITKAFVEWKAQQAVNNQPVTLDEFVFANVPGLDVSKPISNIEAIPADSIVYRQAVSKTGVVNANAVVYSVTLGADVGDFDFNWIGLISKTSGTLAMIIHAPTQRKVKNASGQQGNVLVRSMLMEYSGAQAATNIITPAETWQIDFTARLAGMDEAMRLVNLDVYGAGAFFENGFLVNKTGNQYFVTAGMGYIGGLRATLAGNVNVTITAKPIIVWADVSYSGTLTSAYQTQIKFTQATTLTDYEQSGIKHYVFALASIDANGAITDLRPKNSLINQSLKAHEQSRDHPDATLNDKGFVRLSSDLTSQSESLAATPKMVYQANENANERLAKNKNGADIPDKNEFIKNVGITPKAINALAITNNIYKNGQDVNEAPNNSTFFCYASAKNSPGFDCSVLRYSAAIGNYDVDIATGYGVNKKMAYRTRNGDANEWGAWQFNITESGGVIDYLEGAKYYKVKEGAAEGAGGFGLQYKSAAAFFAPEYVSPKDTSVFVPLCKGRSVTSTVGYGMTTTFGYYRTGGSEYGSAVISLSFDVGESKNFYFNNDGSINTPLGVLATLNKAENFAKSYAKNAEDNSKNYALSTAQSAEESAYNRAVAWARSQSVINVSGATWWSKDISGKITQGGMVIGNGGYIAVNFPAAFPNKCFEVQLTLANGDFVNSKDNVFVTVITNTAFQAVMHSNEYGAYWQATGY